MNQPSTRRTSNATDDAVKIWRTGLDSVRAFPLVHREINVDVQSLWLGDHEFLRREFDRLVVVGAGKAATEMARGLATAIGDQIPMVGWVNVPDGTQSDIPFVHVHPARPAGINEPTQAGVDGTREILRLVRSAGPRDLCIALISGGGSALLVAPKQGITLDDKVAVTRLLSASGADICEINTVRKHLSDVKGGGLLRACGANQLVTLILSDILGDPLDLIASGPTVVDPSSAPDATQVLERYDANQNVPESIRAVLRAAAIDETEPTAKATNIILGNNAVAVDEAGVCAEALGYNHVMQSATQPEGMAEQVGIDLADATMRMLRTDPNDHRVDCLITGGEPVVQLAPESVRGKGGRNQQLVLAAYKRLLEHDLSESEWQRLCILSGGTDGEDGPTDAAGAWVDQRVHQAAVSQRLSADDFLARNDAYSFFDAAGGLLVTGPTGTNVCDIRVTLVKKMR